MRQYIACRFRPFDRRTYTYANDGPPVTVGDRVKVPDKSGDGWNDVEVTAIVGRPAFECKAILGKIEGADVDAKLLAEPAAPVQPDLFGGV